MTDTTPTDSVTLPDGRTAQVVQPDIPAAPADTTLADLQKQFDLYQPYLELIRRTGMPGAAICAKMYLNSAQNIGTGLPNTKVLLDKVVFANGITASLANKRIEITQAGTYLVIGHINYQGIGGSNFYYSQVLINGTDGVAQQLQSSGATQLDPIASSIYQLKGGDYIELVGRGGTTQAAGYGSENGTYLLAFKL